VIPPSTTPHLPHRWAWAGLGWRETGVISLEFPSASFNLALLLLLLLERERDRPPGRCP